MHALVYPAFAALVMLFVGCNTYRVAGAMTFGRTQDISASDIEAAVASYREYMQATYHTEGVPGQIEVVSHDRVRIYYGDAGGGYTEMNRIHGKWRRGSIVIVTE